LYCYYISINTFMQPRIKMACDYYVDRYLVIEYISECGRYCKLTTDLSREPKYISPNFNYDTDDDFTAGQCSSYQRKLEEKIEKHTYRQTIYKKKEWTTSKYMAEYTCRLRHEFPYVYKLKKIYMEFEAFRAENY
jgi:hypothetical protein